MNKTKSNNFLMFLIVAIICGVIAYYMAYAVSDSLEISVISGSIFSVIAFYSFSTRDARVKKKHLDIMNSEAFKKLLSMGFKKVIRKEYHGIEGNYKGYLFELYFDWNVYTTHNSSSALVINLYFQPYLNSDSKIDTTRLYDLSVKYYSCTKNWVSKKFYWRGCALITRMGTVVSANVKYKDVNILMDKTVDILKSENLHPLDSSTLAHYRSQYPKKFVPEVDNYFNEPYISTEQKIIRCRM